MPFERLTWSGLLVVTCGWALLLMGSVPQQIFGRSLVVNFGDIAHYTIMSGFGLALLGALRTGFGTLNRFFESVLERTTRTPGLAVPTGAALPASRAPMFFGPIRKPKPKKVAERGTLKDRAYVRFMDGSVEIETLLGLRHFSSLRDARDFVG